MEFKLGYKAYPFSISLAACKRFTGATGLDLHDVLMDYIHAYTDISKETDLKKVSAMSKLHSRSVACHLFHSITEKESKITLAEFEDATYTTSWFRSEIVDDMSEPWPLVLVSVAFDVNKYINENLHVKKKDT
jgi:hypothetical protein